MTNIPTLEDLDRDAQRGCDRYHYLSDLYPEWYQVGVEDDEKKEPNDTANTEGRLPVVRPEGESDTGRV